MRICLFGTLLIALSCRSTDLPPVPPPPGPGTVQLLLVYAKPGQAALSPAVGARGRLLGSNAEQVADNDEARLVIAGLLQPQGTLHVTFDADGDGRIDHQRLIDLGAAGAGPGKDLFLGTVVLGRNAEAIGRVLKGDRVTSNGGHSGISVFVPEGPFATTTADDGSFRLGGLPEGQVTLTAFAAGYTPVSLTASLRASEALTLSTITLTPSPGDAPVGDVSGSVQLEDGAPASGVSVTATPNATGAARTTSSSGEGAYQLDALPVGVWRLRFERAGLRALELRNVLVTAGRTVVSPVTLAAEGSGAGGGAAGGEGGGDAGGAAGGGGGSAGGGAAGGNGGGGGSTGGPLTIGFGFELDGGVSGLIEWPDGGQCVSGSGGCTQILESGSFFTIRARGKEPWARVTGFSAPCHGAPAGSCTIEVTPGLTVVTSFDRPNLVFVSSEQRIPGDVALEGEPIDVLGRWCNALAADAGLPGTFVPFINYRPVDGGFVLDPFESLVGARGWVRPDGLPVFDTLAAPDQPLYLPSLTEKGQLVPSSVPIATGVFNWGFSANGSCNGWSTRTGYGLYIGNPRNGSREWAQTDINAFVGNCSAAHRFYCFGKDRHLPVTVERPQGARRAFVTLLPVPITDGGVASFDERCAADAVSLGYPGTFRALVPVNGLPAASRVSLDGGPWVRDDGVTVATAAELKLSTAALLAPIHNGPKHSVWAGANGPAVTGRSPCNDWQSTASVDFSGNSLSTGPEWMNDGILMQCGGQSTHVYCFEQ